MDYDVKLGISSTKHGSGRDEKKQSFHIRSNDFVQKIIGKTCDFYGQVVLTGWGDKNSMINKTKYN